MGSSYSCPADKKIVIVGAGYAGTTLGVQLLKHGVDFTIINTRDEFYHNLGAVRATSEEGFIDKLFLPLSKTFNEHFKQGKVVKILPGDNKVVLENGDVVEYDVLIIATGSFGDLPFKPRNDVLKEDIVKECTLTLEMLKSPSCKNIAVIGGGAVGCEVAGELATDYKDKSVTLIHSSDHLIGDKLLTEKFHKSLKQKLESKGVKLVLGEKVENLPSQSITRGHCVLQTNTGKSIEADLVYKCVGMSIESQAYQDTLKDCTELKGQLKVNQFLQVEGHANIFAVGDCNNVAEIKTGYRAMEQAKIVVQNISLFLNQQSLKVYDPKSPPFLIGVSVGRTDAIGSTVGGYNVPVFVLKPMKCKDLMLAKFKKDLLQ